MVLDFLGFPVRDAAHRLDEKSHDVDICRALPFAGERPAESLLKEILRAQVIDPGKVTRRFAQPNPLRIRESADRGGDLVA